MSCGEICRLDRRRDKKEDLAPKTMCPHACVTSQDMPRVEEMPVASGANSQT